MTKELKIHLDRTLCDGFGICAQHAPAYFSLDDWGYACVIGNGTVADEDRDAVMRALMDCPVHAIRELDERKPDDIPPAPSGGDDPAAHLNAGAGEAGWGFTR